MTITLQAKQPDGSWAIRQHFDTENKLVKAGTMTRDELLLKARTAAQSWRNTYQDGKELQVFESR